MQPNAILFPALALVALTFVVWLRLYGERIGQMRRERIHPQAVASSAQMAALVKDSRAADNFRNLFELPVLFYLAVVTAIVTAQVGTTTVTLAWGFVILRCLHSLIHCTYNKVMHRFQAYLLGAIALWALWAALAVGLLR